MIMWINIKDEQPNIGEIVLVYIEYECSQIYPEKVNLIRLAYANVSNLQIMTGYSDRGMDKYKIVPSNETIDASNVKLWMPLPQPPKETE